MGIYREWPERQRLSNGELEVIGFWVMRQAALDRAHYAEVEATHKRDIESIYDTLHYWKRQTLSAREEGETFRVERDQAVTQGNSLADAANAYRLERNEARAEVAEAQSAHNTAVFELHHTRRERDKATAEVAGLIVERSNAEDQRNEARAERDKAREALKSRCADGCEKTLSNLYRAGIERDSARKEVAEAQAAHNMVVFELHHTRKERDSARAESEHHKEIVEANQNIAAERYMEIKALKGELAAAEQEIKIVRAKVCELECKQAAREALASPNRPMGLGEMLAKEIERVGKLGRDIDAAFKAEQDAKQAVKSCGCRVGVPECCDRCQNAKLANEALDSLRFAR